LSYTRTYETAGYRGAAPVAVRTSYVAFRDLRQDQLPVLISKCSGDREALVPAMIKLEHHWVGLAAVDAGMARQVFEQQHDIPSPDTLLAFESPV